ncbi:head maturation protease, ClpP-related [Rhizobium straminoryzae]|uniref:ATP-dependent Clp protease proteolytic subunit n=1 Tax=Rhizobium straminoryzae TaxID=1387186 RepID=A0A549T0U8_9HYPH|nr:head maturation protease, ClpP-related [Rhizobium straminoryzae]TRL35502.1 Clp protease ClpP [Rhizobium straminoryzae]
MTVLVNGELVLYGFVGESYWGDGFTAREVLDALIQHGRDEPITVRINSGGGYVDDGIAIFNALKAHAGKVTVIVDAMAASSASVIAMAGDERLMRTGSMMMIHDPSGGVWGTAADMEAYAKVMEKHAENLASIYAEVTGSDPADIRTDMKAELWMNAEEAVSKGFATAQDKARAKAAAAHDYSVYAHAPQKLVALSQRNDWTRARAQIPAEASAPAKPSIDKEKTMADQNAADVTTADTSKLIAQAVAQALADSKARIKAITGSDEAKGREALAEHLAHETEMTVETALAALKAAPAASTQPASQQATGSYEQQRLAAASLAMPGSTQPTGGAGSDGSWQTAVARANKKMAALKTGR